MNYLDKIGLAKLWNKIVNKINEVMPKKISDLEDDKGIVGEEVLSFEGTKPTLENTYEGNLKELTVYGKSEQIQTETEANLADANVLYEEMKAFKSGNVSETIVDDKNCIRFANSQFRGELGFRGLSNINYKENNQYTIRHLAKVDDVSTVTGSGSLVLEVFYTDGTKDSTSRAAGDGNWIEFRIVTSAEKTVSYIGFSYGTGTAWLLDKDSLFIGEGDVTEYPAFVPNSPSPKYPSPIEFVNNNPNMFDTKTILETNGFVMQSNGYYYGDLNEIHQKYGPDTAGIPDLKFEENTQYTISFWGYRDSASNNYNNGIAFKIYYTDSTSDLLAANTTRPKFYSLTSAKNKTISKITLSWGSISTSYIKEIQIKKGSIVAPYSLYNYNTINITTVTGKNILPRSFGQDLLNRLGISSSNTNNCITKINGNIYFKYRCDLGYQTGENYFIKDVFKENTQYIFKARIMKDNSETNSKANIRVKYTDGTIETLRFGCYLDKYD